MTTARGSGGVVPTMREYFCYADELMSMPPTACGLVLCANPHLHAEAGVVEPARTWREVTATCQAVAKPSGVPTHGITWPNFYSPPRPASRRVST